MKKQIMNLALAGALALGSAGLASAACITPPLGGDASCADINIYGASAQFTYWQNEVPSFLAAECGGAGNVQAQFVNGKQAYQIAEHCGTSHNQTWVVRFANKASFDGIAAITGQDLVATGITNYAGDPDSNGSTAVLGAPGGCQTINLHERTFLDETKANANNVVCETVNVGAADVAAADFSQSSTSATGNIIGPYGTVNGTEVYNGVPSPFMRTFPATGLPTGSGVNAANDYVPFILPFSFFVNNSVKVTKCSGDTDTPSHNGLFCIAGSDPANYCGTGSCTSSTLDNITHPMAVIIFGNKADSWQDFGPWFSDLTLDICVRHAGSGSHATLDWSVMHGEAASGNDDTILAGVANTEGLTSGPGNNNSGYVWFNDGTSDNMKCANRVGYPLACTGSGTPYACCSGSGPAATNGCSPAFGSITYADSDQSLGLPPLGTTYANLAELKYEGEYGRHNSLINGMYDFFTHEHAYTSSASLANAGTATIWSSFKAYVLTKPALPTNEAPYWAYTGDMGWDKLTNEYYPVGIKGNNIYPGDGDL